MDDQKTQRKSRIELGKIYFWTATIRNWFQLLESKESKEIVVSSIKNLSRRGLIDVFGFVVMPNHVHIIWRLNKRNGNEFPHSSFLKHTAHAFKKTLHSFELDKFYVGASNKEFEFWQRDALATELYTPDVAYQKLEYIHSNPVSGKWRLVYDPIEYKYSSYHFYESGEDEFKFLKHIGNEL